MVEPDGGMSTFLNQEYWSKKMEVEKKMLFSWSQFSDAKAAPPPSRRKQLLFITKYTRKVKAGKFLNVIFIYFLILKAHSIICYASTIQMGVGIHEQEDSIYLQLQSCL
ncbi:hypothetical protein TorRG33x02_092120 [Trema orientale]|uniref:Uncharacterized protein n=1 Tax=Trema orientale TaxID=63057 RepID=A0A2P5FB60_TREOI|nr:hypothetical protein TorRG33x02_092120 [Trema orientale]